MTPLAMMADQNWLSNESVIGRICLMALSESVGLCIILVCPFSKSCRFTFCSHSSLFSDTSYFFVIHL
jgi:hypothetical protein